jgi:hypothetical protein
MATMLLAGLWHGAGWNFVFWGGLHGLFLVIHKQYRRLFGPLPAFVARPLTLAAVILAWVPFRAGSMTATWTILKGMAGCNGTVLPRMIVSALPPLAVVADPVSVMPFLGDARTRSFPEISACLLLGWLIVLTLPNVHRMTERGRQWSLTASFALAVQALFFAPQGAVPVFSVLMRRILISCFGSLLLCGFAFCCLLDRPLTLGALNARTEANLALGQIIRRPKLVILAGSNGPYSHRC